jgi:hypothetical protein
MTAIRTRYRARTRRLSGDSWLLDTDVSSAMREQFWCWMLGDSLFSSVIAVSGVRMMDASRHDVIGMIVVLRRGMPASRSMLVTRVVSPGVVRFTALFGSRFHDEPPPSWRATRIPT